MRIYLNRRSFRLKKQYIYLILVYQTEHVGNLIRDKYVLSVRIPTCLGETVVELEHRLDPSTREYVDDRPILNSVFKLILFSEYQNSHIYSGSFLNVIKAISKENGGFLFKIRGTIYKSAKYVTLKLSSLFSF